MSTPETKSLAERFQAKARDARRKAAELRKEMDLHIREAETWEEAASEVKALGDSLYSKQIERVLCSSRKDAV